MASWHLPNKPPRRMRKLLRQLFPILSLLLCGFIVVFLYAHQRTHGSLDITTESVAYNRMQYGHVIDWDKYAVSIEGVPTMIYSGEFHYWRLPDRDRWEKVLKQYLALGMNTIRVYFHWGYHSPKEGVYYFDGNRDVDYLLSLCEKLGIYVLAAPGPYICAESQGGGYPSWLIAKRELNIRHNRIMLWRTYDNTFANYEIQWLEQILPIIARHQITNKGNKKGCVLSVQVDNELFETMPDFYYLPVGLRDQMRVLAKATRDLGITVPLFTNDGFEEGSWIPYTKADRQNGLWSGRRFGIDWYGFDKYVVLISNGVPDKFMNDGSQLTDADTPWNPKNVESMDKLESVVRGFGGGAANSPMFIPELQGGWFNGLQSKHTFDHIYNYFGSHFTKNIVETSLAQGVGMLSLYMVYGGTNWGTIGDPDTHTSYDYSACIREYGYISSRGRHLRETILFGRSFDPYFTKTDFVSQPNVRSSIPNTINRQRVSASVTDQPVEFTFLRNFDRQQRDVFDLTVSTPNFELTMGCYLPYKNTFIALGNYKAANGLHLIMSTVPILARMVSEYSNDEVWVVSHNNIGSMAFYQTKATILTGNLHRQKTQPNDNAFILTFNERPGWSRISTSIGNLHIVGIDSQDASTLYGHFEEAYWNNGRKRYPSMLAWGADYIFYDSHQKKLEVQYRRQDTELHVLSFNPPKSISKWDTQKGVFNSLSIHYSTILTRQPNHALPLPVEIQLEAWQARTVDFPALPWAPLRTFGNSKKPSWDALDYGYTSGQIFYRTQFTSPAVSKPRVSLSLNVRHRATVILNGRIVGGHTTYSLLTFFPGAKIGPDPWFLGTQEYDLSHHLEQQEAGFLNDLVIMVDSFGLNRDGFLMNDVRNPRGIISVELHGLDSTENTRTKKRWRISGVNTHNLPNAYNSTGFPDESQTYGWRPFRSLSAYGYTYHFSLLPEQGVRWMQFRFDFPVKSMQESVTIPLRIRLDGEWTSKIFLNDVLIGLYYANRDSPQHDFYLPDDLVRPEGNVIKMVTYTWTETIGKVSINGWPINANTGNIVLNAEPRPLEYMTWKGEWFW